MKNNVRDFNATVMPSPRMRPVPLCPPAKRRQGRLGVALVLCAVFATAGCAWQWRGRSVTAAESMEVALPTRMAKVGEDPNVRRVAQIQQLNGGDGHKYYWCYDDGCKQPTPKTTWTPLAAQAYLTLPPAAQTKPVLSAATASTEGAAARTLIPEDKGTDAQVYQSPVLPVPLVDAPRGTARTVLPTNPNPNAGAASVTSPPLTPSIVYEEVARVLHFGSGKTNVDDRALAELNLLMPAIENADFIVLRGLTDSDGTTRTNRRLAITRALVVKDLLVSRGINPAVIAFTETAGTYLAPNDSSESKSRNRAVEIKIRIPRS